MMIKFFIPALCLAGALTIAGIAVNYNSVNITGDTVIVLPKEDEIIPYNQNDKSKSPDAYHANDEESQDELTQELRNKDSSETVEINGRDVPVEIIEIIEERIDNVDDLSDEELDTLIEEIEEELEEEPEEEHEKEKESSTNSKISTCYMQITCEPFLDDTSDNIRKQLPSDGIMMGTTQVEIKNGDSAYDILLRVCQNKGIPLSATNSIFGAYIKSIDNLSEKYYDNSTGWCYVVNGEYPSVAADKYTIHKGDMIVWIYDSWSF